MQRHPNYLEIRALRNAGHTYSEISNLLNIQTSKSTLSGICKDIKLSAKSKARIQKIKNANLAVARQKALESNSQKLKEKILALRLKNLHLESVAVKQDLKIVSLAMLYLGEGAKWRSRRGPMLGSSDPKIIRMYLYLLKECFEIDLSKVRARIQHRADQDSAVLLKFWSSQTGIPKDKFYPAYIDKRTVGKKTKKTTYMGVCAITSPGTHIQLELEQVTDIIYEAWGVSSAG